MIDRSGLIMTPYNAIAGVVPSFFADRILNAIPARIAVLASDGTIIATNARWNLFRGDNAWSTAGKEVGTNYLLSCEKARGDAAAEARDAACGIQAVLRTETDYYTQEYSLTSSEGTQWFQLTVTPMLDEDISGAVVVHHDITARRQSEVANEANQARTRLLADIASEIVSRISIEDIIARTVRRLHNFFPAHQVIYATISMDNIMMVTHSQEPSGMTNLVGQTADLNTASAFLEWLRKEEAIIVPNVGVAEVLTPLAAAMQEDGIHALLDVTLPHPHEQAGLLCLNSPRIHAWSDHEIATLKEVAQYLAFAIWNADIQQEHLRTEEALRFSNTRLNLIARVTGTILGSAPLEDQARELAEHMRQAFDVDSCIIRTLEKEDLVLLASAGVPEEALTERIPANFGITKEIFSTLQPIAIADIHQHPRTRDIVGKLPNGYRFTSYAGAPLLVEDQVIGVLGIFARSQRREFTESDLEHLQIVANHVAVAIENNRLYRELDSQKEQLLHAQKMEGIGRLAGGIAHDFNNLLTAVLGFVELISDNLDKSDPNQAYLAQIQRAGDRAADLTRQLLTFARKQIIQPRVICLNTLLQNMEQLLRPLIGEDIELIILPSRETLFVRIDPGQCEQVLVNLVVNARDAMPSGGTLILKLEHVTYREFTPESDWENRSESYARLSVTDSGIGMDAATQSRIFEPFFTTKEVGKGTGLGLATCYGIIAQAGGHISVHSEIEQGTTFQVYLPVSSSHLDTQTDQTTGEPAIGGSETILLVEDEAQVREMATTVLRNQGYNVLAASDGREALRLWNACQGEIHLILTDVVMPYMSGREVAQRLKQSDPDVQVLYVSGYTDNTALYQECLLKEESFLAKPFSPVELLRAVRAALKKTA